MTGFHDPALRLYRLYRLARADEIRPGHVIVDDLANDLLVDEVALRSAAVVLYCRRPDAPAGRRLALRRALDEPIVVLPSTLGDVVEALAALLGDRYPLVPHGTCAIPLARGWALRVEFPPDPVAVLEELAHEVDFAHHYEVEESG